MREQDRGGLKRLDLSVTMRLQFFVWRAEYFCRALSLMSDSASSVVSTVDSVTIVCPTAGVSNLYEGQLESVGLTTEFSSKLATPLMIVNMRHVKFIGSAFLGRMIAIQKDLATSDGGRLALVEMSSFCRAAMSVSKLDTVLEIFPTVADAIKAFGRNG